MRLNSEFDRRSFCKFGAALIVEFCVPFRGRAQTSGPETGLRANAWVTISADDKIVVITEIPEMGQGTRTADVMMLADELEADWATIGVEQAPTLPEIYKHLHTGGSGGTEATWMPMRRAGAQARELLVTAAAERWNVARTECRAENGTIVHSATGRHFRYGELVATVSKLPVPPLDEVPLKDRPNFRFIGKSMPRVDTPAKVDGSAIFGIDVRVPEMLYAVIARCPYFVGDLASCDDAAAKRQPGVRAVFRVPPIGFTIVAPDVGRNINVAAGVAVVAASTWAAIQGRNALKLDWRKGPGAEESTETLRKALQSQATAPASVVVMDRGDTRKVLQQSAKKIEAEYELPFQSHATMEPMNATVHVRQDGTIEVWSPTQIPEITQSEIAALAGVSPDRVTVHTTLSGGSFGRRYQFDYAAEAWQIAKKMKVPVKLLWTREDDMQHDFYRQYCLQRLSGSLDEGGKIIAWAHRMVSTPIRSVFDSAESLKDPKQVASQEIPEAPFPYQVSYYRMDYAPVHSVVPRAWWRSVSSSLTAFATECFMDELAHSAAIDPCEFRLKNLGGGQGWSTQKYRAVLELAADKSGWGKPLPKGGGRGIACYMFAETCVAHVAEVLVDAEGSLKLQRIVSAVDCGLAVNPDSVRAQIESGINYALTPILSGEITVKEGAVEQSNFHDYQVLRMTDAPDIEVHIVPQGKEPGNGVGESGVPPVAPAVANAIFTATRIRVRRLPVDTNLLRRS
jgi:isoquinoline 1-oxidoreductase beta subunit